MLETFDRESASDLRANASRLDLSLRKLHVLGNIGDAADGGTKMRARLQADAYIVPANWRIYCLPQAIFIRWRAQEPAAHRVSPGGIRGVAALPARYAEVL